MEKNFLSYVRVWKFTAKFRAKVCICMRCRYEEVCRSLWKHWPAISFLYKDLYFLRDWFGLRLHLRLLIVVLSHNNFIESLSRGSLHQSFQQKYVHVCIVVVRRYADLHENTDQQFHFYTKIYTFWRHCFGLHLWRCTLSRGMQIFVKTLTGNSIFMHLYRRLVRFTFMAMYRYMESRYANIHDYRSHNFIE